MLIQAENVSKQYVIKKGSIFNRKIEYIKALNNFSLTVDNGEIIGLLGPNGAGKTTFIKILSTLLIPDSGSIWVNGYNINDEKNVRRSIGVVFPGERTLFWKLTIYENMIYFGTLYRLNEIYLKKRIKYLSKKLDIMDILDKRVELLSNGLRQRAVLMRALLSDPPILLLDEPTLGLDPVSAKSFRDHIRFLKSEGKGILLTTHYMYEADELSDRVIFINKGEKVEEGEPQKLKSTVQIDQKVIFIFKGDDTKFLNYLKGQDENLKAIKKIISMKIIKKSYGTQLECTTNNKEDLTNYIRKLSKKFNIEIKQIIYPETTLEDVFIIKTGRVINEEENI